MVHESGGQNESIGNELQSCKKWSNSSNIVTACLEKKHDIKNICIDDYDIKFCKGCRKCHTTAKCVQKDDVDRIIEQYEWADVIISVSPSYWADIPG